MDLFKEMTQKSAGFGYLSHPSRNEEMDKIVYKVLKKKKIDKKSMFLFLDSSFGRYMADQLSENPSNSEEIIYSYLKYLTILERENVAV